MTHPAVDPLSAEKAAVWRPELVQRQAEVLRTLARINSQISRCDLALGATAPIPAPRTP